LAQYQIKEKLKRKRRLVPVSDTVHPVELSDKEHASAEAKGTENKAEVEQLVSTEDHHMDNDKSDDESQIHEEIEFAASHWSICRK